MPRIRFAFLVTFVKFKLTAVHNVANCSFQGYWSKVLLGGVISFPFSFKNKNS